MATSAPRFLYLGVTAALLVYLGQHEIRLRTELGRLAHWPATGGLDAEASLSRVLEHAARTLGAGRALVMWEDGEELGDYRPAVVGGVVTV